MILLMCIVLVVSVGVILWALWGDVDEDWIDTRSQQ